MKKNYLDKIPVHSAKISHTADKNGLVTLQIKNNGTVNFIAQKLLKKPQTSYIHLDETGSFVWLSIDGNRNIYNIASLVDEKFGNKSYPLYERVASFFMILDKNDLISWIK